jgi:hypothetical protein
VQEFPDPDFQQPDKITIIRMSASHRAESPLPIAACLFKGPSASIGDADALNQSRYAASRHHRLGHNSCKLCVHKAAQQLDREAVRYEQVLAKTTRGTCKLFEGPALFTAKTKHQGRGRLPAWGTEHVTGTTKLTPSPFLLCRPKITRTDQAFRRPKSGRR